MKHARTEALDALEPLLLELRKHGALKERSRGVFYLRSKAFLHFHEDPEGLFADVRNQEGEFERSKVDTAAEQKRFLVVVARLLGAHRA